MPDELPMTARFAAAAVLLATTLPGAPAAAAVDLASMWDYAALHPQARQGAAT